jgi:hypothetical protein
MCHRTLLSLLAAILLSACAAAMPGYTPDKPILPASDPGTMTAGGTYQLSETENKLDCRRLNGSMYIIIALLPGFAMRRTASRPRTLRHLRRRCRH